MKKGLLFMSLVLGLGVVNAQNTNVLLSKDGSAHSEHKQVVNPNHKATTFTVVNNTKDPIPAGHARVSLTAGDVWGDGSGYQLLLDADATAFGVEIPETGGSLTPSGNVPASVYAVFEYKIPINADGSLTTTNIVIDNTIAIDIPAGTYDWVILIQLLVTECGFLQEEEVTIKLLLLAQNINSMLLLMDKMTLSL
ncbi:MAG: DUF2436 domain-containing protein [Bacteroidales bacterium]